jgi:hypothetical protein
MRQVYAAGIDVVERYGDVPDRRARNSFSCREWFL